MGTATAKRRRRELPPEVKQELDERDAHAREEADRVLSDPGQVAWLVDRLLYTQLGPKVLSYSLRNQAMVVAQCMERGIPLTDVASRQTWNRRGRGIRGPGLRIVQYAGDDKDDRAEAAEPADTADTGGEDEKSGRSKFAMKSVWAFAQTTDGCREPTEEFDETPVSDAARVLIESVTVQLGRAGYRILEVDPDDEQAHRASNIDHAARTVTLSADWAAKERLLAMVMCLAQVLTMPRPDRKAG